MLKKVGCLAFALIAIIVIISVAASSGDDKPARKPAPTESTPVVLTVPDVRGDNAAVAADELSAAGYKNVDFGSVDPFHKIVILPQDWEVESQSATPGTHLDADRLIVLSVTKEN